MITCPRNNMTTLTGTAETTSLSLLDAMTALWRKETISMVAVAVRRAIESVPDVRIISIEYSLEDDGTRCLHVVLDVETDAGTRRLAFYRRAPGLSFTKGTWIPKRLLAVRVMVERSWVTDAWLAQLGPTAALQEADIPTAAEALMSIMGNIPLSRVLEHRWKPDDLVKVHRAIESAIQDRACMFGDPILAGKRVYVVLKVFESNGWRREFWHSPSLGTIQSVWERCASTEATRARPKPTFDPTQVNVRIPITLFFN